MRRSFSAILISLFVLSNISCASKMPDSYNQQTKTLYVLTDVVNSIGTLQMAAENAVPQKILKLNDARIIVQFCVDANTTIGQYPNGWYSIVNTAWLQAKAHLDQDELNKFAGAIAAFEIVLNSFSGGK